MKTQEELKVLKEEFGALKAKLEELNEDELKAVTGGIFFCAPEEHNIFLTTGQNSSEEHLGGKIYPIPSDEVINPGGVCGENKVK